ncbi:hypothetical protein DM815_01040 [Blattabacterium sp. (Cryptocercus kyebangensis)]|uniref:outer membrane protein assembly factor BamD n=1 Tax=Blattabacterium sp. (Cryptocercus kyebangensis) TaxID=298656 RepID=UPI000D7C35CC|nr:tetratricopeptide repeat protein [Blattabacterium sp. (Cryptocercus kyebangensis)]AWU44001.1 hypothetical protein DM815_01040 [Blattabacterium sp. (Cryptocercus kyebangensis)]
MNNKKTIFLLLFVIIGCYDGQHLLLLKDSDLSNNSGKHPNHISKWSPHFYKNENEIPVLKNILKKLNLFSKKKYLGKNYEENESFKRGFTYYLDSLNFDLDQKKTKEAIEVLNKFIKEYPNSSKSAEVNDILNELSKKLEKKNYYIANTYFFMKKYKASLIYFQDFLNNFPKSDLREDVLYKICLIAYKLSIKNGNYSNFIEEYHRYVESYPNSPNIKKLKIFYEKLLK